MVIEAVLEPPMNKREHWDEVYAEKGEGDLSWSQEEPLRSLRLIRAVAPDRGAPIIDVGGGTSALVDRLLEQGYGALTVLDVSPAALAQTRSRLGARGDQVRWEIADVTQSGHLGQFEVWHDRAVFHFLTRESDRERYVALAEQSIPRGGYLIIATFSLDGPERCSGLPVRRYDPASLAHVFSYGFDLVWSEFETHFTPWGTPQPFVYCALRRV